jgi:hypothetical protein
MQGKSSWMSEYAWIISTAEAAIFSRSGVRSVSAPAPRHEHGANALSAAERRVTHRVVQARGAIREAGSSSARAPPTRGRLARPAWKSGRSLLGVEVAQLPAVEDRDAAWASASFDSQNLMSSAPRW